MPDLFDLSGQTALVTGGGGLIGSAICEVLATYEADVVVAEYDEIEGESVADAIGNRAEFRQIDITNESSVENLVDSVATDYDGIDILVNAAYPRTDSYGQPFEDVSLTEWNKNVSMHLGGYYATCHHVARAMVERGNGGRIVNLGSIYGVQAPDFSVYDGTDMTSPVEYAGIKGGIVNLSKYLAAYLGPQNIRVNTVSPGGVFNDQNEVFVENYKERTPLGRMAKPEDITGAVLYLVSPAASYVTGQNLVVDGGWTVN